MKLRVIRRLTVLAITVLAMLAFASPAWAETFTVTKTADSLPGACDSDCSLREAINASNTNGQTDTIEFASTVRGTITLGLGSLSISDDTPAVDLTINGPGQDALTVSGRDAVRVFQTNGAPTINGLKISNGKVTGANGGGITNNGALTLNNSTVSGNSATDDFGGGITNSGSLTLN